MTRTVYAVLTLPLDCVISSSSKFLVVLAFTFFSLLKLNKVSFLSQYGFSTKCKTFYTYCAVLYINYGWREKNYTHVANFYGS